MEIVKWDFWKSSLKRELIGHSLFVLHPFFLLASFNVDMKVGATAAIQGHKANLRTETIYVLRIANQKKREAVSVELNPQQQPGERKRLELRNQDTYL